MATIGSQLTAPESGWKRYDDTHPAIKYEGAGWSTSTNTGHYQGKCLYTNSITGKIRFKFTGKNLRIIVPFDTDVNRATCTISIDGIKEQYSLISSAWMGQILAYEKTNLTDKEHIVEISSDVDNIVFPLDAIDIDSTGRLFHPDEVLTPDELEVGKRIRAHYTASTANTVGTFSNLGEETYVDGINDFIPPASSATPNGDFYFIMVDEGNGKKKLIADRNIQHSISWDTLNSEGIASGSGLPTLLKVNPNNLTATASSEYDLNHTAYFTLDGDVDSKWLAMDTSSGWIKVELQESKIVKMYTVQAWSNTSTGHTRAPKDWTFEGSNDDVNWDILDVRIGETWQPSEKKNFKIDNDKLSGYKYYRLNISNNNGNSDLSVGEWELYESFDDFAFTTRLLTGGISSTDNKDNEWDNYIVNSTLDGTITAGDDNVWNWNGVWTWASTSLNNDATKRIFRGYNSVTGYGSNITSTNGNSSGFRPVLEIESLEAPPIYKYFIYDEGHYKKWVDGETEVGNMIKDDMYSEEGTLLRYPLSKYLTHMEVK